MLKIGCFTHSNISVSETFIFDLFKSFQLSEEVDLTVFGGNKKHNIEGIKNINVVSTGYYESGYEKSFYKYKIGQIIGGKGHEYKNNYRKKKSYQALVKTINNTNALDVAYIDYLTSAVLCYEFMTKKKIPFIVHVHGYDITQALNDFVYKNELKNVFKTACYLIAASHYIRKILILNGCPEDKIKVIRYGIDSERVNPISWQKRLKHNPSIVFLGRLTPKKHPIALVHAFNLVQKSIPEVELTIIGDGELMTEVQQCIKILKLDNKVHMLGPLSREESFPILNKHWIYAQHSVTSLTGDQEGFAISLAEAALHELPVVSTYHNGIPENVIDGETGLLVKEFDYEGMAERIICLINDTDLAEKMGKAGRKHITNLCNHELRVNSIIKLFKRCLD